MVKLLSLEIPPHGLLVAWKRRCAALQRALARAQHENRVRGECLEIAKKALKEIWWKNKYPYGRIAGDALVKIVARLAQLEPEEETG